MLIVSWFARVHVWDVVGDKGQLMFFSLRRRAGDGNRERATLRFYIKHLLQLRNTTTSLPLTLPQITYTLKSIHVEYAVNSL